MSTTRICFIRHGETAWNTERRLQGQLDIPLNEQGLQQARAAGRWLANRDPIDALYSSDLQRAWTTATHIAAAIGLAPMAESALRERKYGAFEGLTYVEANERYPEAYAEMEARNPDFPIPGGGESLREFHQRVSGAVVRLAKTHPGQTIAVVLHGGVLDIINRFVRGNPLHTPRDFLIPNTGLNWIVLENDQWRIETWGDTRHLQSDALDELPG